MNRHCRFWQRSRIAYNSPVFYWPDRLCRACSSACGGAGQMYSAGTFTSSANQPNLGFSDNSERWFAVKFCLVAQPFFRPSATKITNPNLGDCWYLQSPARSLSGKFRSVKKGFSVMIARSKIGYGNRRKIPFVGPWPSTWYRTPAKQFHLHPCGKTHFCFRWHQIVLITDKKTLRLVSVVSRQHELIVYHSCPKFCDLGFSSFLRGNGPQWFDGLLFL